MIDARIKRLGDALVKKHGLSEPSNFHIVSQAEIVAVGMVCVGDDEERDGGSDSGIPLRYIDSLT